MSTRMLVAGVGNIFKSDDGFAAEVVAWLEEHLMDDWPDDVRLRDYGTGGIHLAYELLDGYDEVIIIDAMHRQQAVPGTLFVVEPDLAQPGAGRRPGGAIVDPHDLGPESALSLVPGLGGTLGHVVVVGCQPESTADGMGLSPAVARRVPEAGLLVCRLVSDVLSQVQDCSSTRSGAIVRRWP